MSCHSGTTRELVDPVRVEVSKPASGRFWAPSSAENPELLNESGGVYGVTPVTAASGRVAPALWEPCRRGKKEKNTFDECGHQNNRRAPGLIVLSAPGSARRVREFQSVQVPAGTRYLQVK
ncbi:hypothetical protein FTUN_6793 [Frigoriglobus tundricola]|uniref:Uncharacterized protein n=1 Tax=Frigoriglobus tundricola TaxID=2774151 RepID=A0A6M5Z162_9BACT|nr:hypothetical protein FTUN_6793 [Frigoriglobus tundricola]